MSSPAAAAAAARALTRTRMPKSGYAAVQAALLPLTKPLVEDHFGVEVEDPYRAFEDVKGRGDDIKAWGEAQHSLFTEYAKDMDSGKYRGFLKEMWSFPAYGLPYTRGNHTFMYHNPGEENHASLYVVPSEDAGPEHPDSRRLLDPNAMSEDGTVSMRVAKASPSGELVAYITSVAGSDWGEARVRNVGSGEDTPDVLKWLKFSGIAWTKDNSGFLYSKFPVPESLKAKVDAGEEVDMGLENEELGNQSIYFHQLGTPQSQDRKLVTMWDDVMTGATISDCGHFVVFESTKGCLPSNSVHVKRIIAEGSDPKTTAPDFDLAPIRTVVGSLHAAKYNFVANRGSDFFFECTDSAARGKIVKVAVKDEDTPEAAGGDLASLKEESTPDLRSSFTTVVPEREDGAVLSDVGSGNHENHLVLHYMKDVQSELWVADLTVDGGKVEPWKVDAPECTALHSMSVSQTADHAYAKFTAYTNPGVAIKFSLAGPAPREVVRTVEVPGLDASEFETRQVWFPSEDGTKVPMFINAKKGTTPTRALVYVYGGFNISLQPNFSLIASSWMRGGGAYVVVNARGGGEFGEEWYEAGRLGNLRNTIVDTASAGRYLREHEGFQRLGLMGFSNGGFTTGATINHAPEVFDAAVPGVGVMDLMRFHVHTIGKAWKSDYGDVSTEEGFKVIHSLSPLVNVPATAPEGFPAVMVVTGLYDDRVSPAHSFKYLSRLQATAPDNGSPRILRVELKGGHGAGKPRSLVIEEYGDILGFLDHETQIREE